MARKMIPALAVLLLLGSACDRAPAPDATAPATPLYALSDTAPYQNLITSGTYALLRRGDDFVDTVDVAFGVQNLGRDSVLFLPVRSETLQEGGTAQSITEHVFFDGTKQDAQRTPLNEIVPNFDSHFSSPAVLAGALYYWGIFQSNGIDSVHAVRYDFGRRRLNTLPLPATIPGTDDRFYFTPPFLDRKEFVFKAPTGEWRFRVPKQR